MYIECKTFDEWLDYAASSNGISPGGMAKDFRVTRQTINNWINDNTIDAYKYDGREGQYVIIDMKEYDRVRRFKEKYSNV